MKADPDQILTPEDFKKLIAGALSETREEHLRNFYKTLLSQQATLKQPEYQSAFYQQVNDKSVAKKKFVDLIKVVFLIHISFENGCREENIKKLLESLSTINPSSRYEIKQKADVDILLFIYFKHNYADPIRYLLSLKSAISASIYLEELKIFFKIDSKKIDISISQFSLNQSIKKYPSRNDVETKKVIEIKNNCRILLFNFSMKLLNPQINNKQINNVISKRAYAKLCLKSVYDFMTEAGSEKKYTLCGINLLKEMAALGNVDSIDDIANLYFSRPVIFSDLKTEMIWYFNNIRQLLANNQVNKEFSKEKLNSCLDKLDQHGIIEKINWRAIVDQFETDNANCNILNVMDFLIHKLTLKITEKQQCPVWLSMKFIVLYASGEIEKEKSECRKVYEEVVQSFLKNEYKVSLSISLADEILKWFRRGINPKHSIKPAELKNQAVKNVEDNGKSKLPKLTMFTSFYIGQMRNKNRKATKLLSLAETCQLKEVTQNQYYHIRLEKILLERELFIILNSSGNQYFTIPIRKDPVCENEKKTNEQIMHFWNSMSEKYRKDVCGHIVDKVTEVLPMKEVIEESLTSTSDLEATNSYASKSRFLS